MTVHTNIVPETGAVIEAPLNRLKKSPRNARVTPHAPSEIEALAGSIAAKGVLQPLVVEPECDAAGEPTGDYFVTIGEGRRQAHLWLAKRKRIKKTHPVRCIVDVANDAREISLDENVTRFAMHPADQFEAFRRLAEERGWGAEEIAARFGVSAKLVRQRLRLARVSPRLIGLYRAEELSLEQLMAFTLTDDHDRQEAVWERLGWSREPYAIRRMLTEDRVSPRDKRAVFVGAEAYEAAGGLIERDLFAEDGGGYFADPDLLDRLALEKLEKAAEAERQAGWAWVEVALDYPPAHGLRRLYAKARPLTEAEQAEIDTLRADHDALYATWEDADEVPDEVARQLDAWAERIDEVTDAAYGYEPEAQAIGGVFVVLGHDGKVRFERGFVRPQDEPPVEAQTDGAAAEVSPKPDERPAPATPGLSDRLIADLTAHRTAALRDRLAAEPQVALLALTHGLVLAAFYFGHDLGSCLELRVTSTALAAHAEGYADTVAGRAIEARHSAFAARLPDDPEAVWEALSQWPDEDRLAVLAHCVSLSVNAVRLFAQRPRALAHADRLAEAVSVDLGDYWTPTAASYFGRVTKPLILEAVSEACSPAEAARIERLKKDEMAAEAERMMAETGWLPAVLRPVAEA